MISEIGVYAQSISFVGGDLVGDVVRNITFVSIVILTDIVRKLRLVEVGLSMISVPLD